MKPALLYTLIAVVVVIIAIVAYVMLATPAFTLPAGFTNGTVIGVDGLGIWRIENNTRRWYTPASYAAEGSPAWTRVTDIAGFESIPRGADM